MIASTRRTVGSALLVLVVLLLQGALASGGPLTLELDGDALAGGTARVVVRGADAGPMHVALLPVDAAAPASAAADVGRAHVHAPQAGWNDVHVPADGAPVVTAAYVDADPPRPAHARAPEPLAGGGWRVPVLLAWPGNWTLDVMADGEHESLDVFASAGGGDTRLRSPRKEGPTLPLLVAREPAVVTHDASFTLLLFDEADGEFRPLSDGARASLAVLEREGPEGGGAYRLDAPLARTGPSTFAGDVALPPGHYEFRVNVTDEGIPGASVSLATRVWPAGTARDVPAERDGEAWAADLPVVAAGDWVAVAHSAGGHGEFALSVPAPAEPYALLAPTWFPTPGPIEANLTFHAPDGAIAKPPDGDVRARLQPNGTDVPLERAGDAFVVRLVLPNGSFSLEVEAGGRTATLPLRIGNNSAEGDAPDQAASPTSLKAPWIGHPAVAGGLAALGVLGVGFALYRGRRMRERPR